MVVPSYIILLHVTTHLISVVHPQGPTFGYIWMIHHETWDGLPQELSGESLGQQYKAPTRCKNEVGYGMDFNGR